MSAEKPVWFLTGCSTGFGRELAKLLLERGYRVVVTARDPASLAEFPAAFPDRALALRLDVTKPLEIEQATNAAAARFGRIDVLVNNAGYGYLAAIEEGEEEEIRDMFQTNVFGLAAMTRAVLPLMRAQKSGFVVNISSIGGFVGGPGIGYYNATKFAVEGLSEALAKEAGPLGLKVLIVEPGPFRTDWAGRSLRTPQKAIDAYAQTAVARREFAKRRSGAQPGDPVRGAQAIVDTVESSNPPLRLLLGAMAVEGARAKLEELRKEIDAMEAVSLGADYPQTG